jgi:hypothetical protein
MVQARGAETDAYLALVTAIGISPLSKPRIAEMPVRPLSPALHGPSSRSWNQPSRGDPTCWAPTQSSGPARPKVKAVEAEFLPKVFMSAFTSYASGRVFDHGDPLGGPAGTDRGNLNGYRYGASVFLGITVPIYDGGLRSAVLTQARNDADSASTKLTRAKEESVRQVVVSQSARNSLAAYEAAKPLADAAQITYDAAFAAYRKGVGTVTDANLAQNQLLLARNASSDAYSGALSAAAALARPRGGRRDTRAGRLGTALSGYAPAEGRRPDHDHETACG